MLTLNGVMLGEYAERSGSLSFNVARPQGLNKAARPPSYTTGASDEELTISFYTHTLGESLDTLKAFLTNGDGVYYLYDADNHIYLGQHGVWVNIEKISYTEDIQDHANNINRGTVTLNCVVAKDGTGSSYDPS